jgi:hypothetical protein
MLTPTKLLETISNIQWKHTKNCQHSAEIIIRSASKRDYQKEEEAGERNISVLGNGSAENELLRR